MLKLIPMVNLKRPLHFLEVAWKQGMYAISTFLFEIIKNMCGSGGTGLETLLLGRLRQEKYKFGAPMSYRVSPRS